MFKVKNMYGLNNIPLYRRVVRKVLFVTAPLWGDEIFLKFFYWANMGIFLNLKNPQTFTEKIQWLKIHSRDILLTSLVDKYAAKKYVSDIIGDEYIIPTLGVWNNPDEIDFDALPNQFVLKVTHDSGGICICRNKETFNRNEAVTKLKNALKKNFYAITREWPYKNVPRRIIAETYMEDNLYQNSPNLIDYKFYCFNGNPTFCQVIRDRGEKETIDFYDMNWSHLPFVGLNPFASNGIVPVKKPSLFPEMKQIAKILSSSYPFSRIDLYFINGKIYFGEITFFPASGYGKFSPYKWDKELGDLIQLPLNADM